MDSPVTPAFQYERSTFSREAPADRTVEQDLYTVRHVIQLSYDRITERGIACEYTVARDRDITIYVYKIPKKAKFIYKSTYCVPLKFAICQEYTDDNYV